MTTPSMCNNSTPSPTMLTGGLAGYLVTDGFDEVTGLGSIDVWNLLANWAETTFSWAANGTTSTVLAGQVAVYNFNATPSGGSGTFAAGVTFACSGLPDTIVRCDFTPAQIAAGAGATAVQVAIKTLGPNTPVGGIRRHASAKRSPVLPMVLPLVGMVMFGLAGRKISRYPARAGVCVSLMALGLLVACGGGGSSNNTPPPVAVSVSQGVPASVYPNNSGWPSQTAQFTATVTNASNTAVTWSVSTANGGSISASGVYMAPTVAAGLPASVIITATAVADSTKSGQATEALNPATIPNTYSNIMITATEGTTVNSVPVTLVVQ